jgi:hypothetical protein
MKGEESVILWQVMRVHINSLHLHVSPPQFQGDAESILLELPSFGTAVPPGQTERTVK